MSGKVLHLAPGLDVPAEEFIESATGIIGKRKSGKSGAIKVIEEELFRVNLPFITLDPVGVHWGIRSSFDGKGPGLDVLVIGGEHGDLPLNRHAGAEIARGIVEANISCIIDFSREPKSVYREFVRDFANELFAINDSPRVVIIEEAPELVPQKAFPEMRETYAAVERLVSRGRNQNIGVVVCGQRLATMSKDVLTQIDNLFIGRLLGTPDLKQLGAWCEAWDVKKQMAEVRAALPSLPTRTMYVWSPETLNVFKQIRFREFKTLHGDKTHLRRLDLLKVKLVTRDVAGTVERLGVRLSKLREQKVELADVPKLRAQVRKLQSDLERERASPKQTAPKVDTKKLVDEAVAPYRAQEKVLRSALVESNRLVSKAKTLGEQLTGLVPVDVLPITTVQSPGSANASSDLGTTQSRFRYGVLKPSGSSFSPHASVRTESSSLRLVGVLEPNGGEIHLKKGAVRMLAELASRHPLTLTRSQLATLVGMTARGGTFSTYLSHLKRAEFLVEDHDGSVRVTEAGLGFVGEVPPAPSTHDEIMARWRKSFKSGTYRMLEAVVSKHPESVTREDLAMETGFEVTGGTFSTYLSILFRNELVVKDGDGLVASEALFPEATG